MHQTRKGQQCYSGMKAHIGVDVESGLVHAVTTTPANVNEVDKLLHGKLIYSAAREGQRPTPLKGRFAISRGVLIP